MGTCTHTCHTQLQLLLEIATWRLKGSVDRNERRSGKERPGAHHFPIPTLDSLALYSPCLSLTLIPHLYLQSSLDFCLYWAHLICSLIHIQVRTSEPVQQVSDEASCPSSQIDSKRPKRSHRPQGQVEILSSHPATYHQPHPPQFHHQTSPPPTPHQAIEHPPPTHIPPSPHPLPHPHPATILTLSPQITGESIRISDHECLSLQ